MLQRAIHRIFRMLFLLVLIAGLGLPSKTQAQDIVYKMFYPTMLIRQAMYRTDLQLFNIGSSEALVQIDLSGPNGTDSLASTIQPGSTLLVTEDNFPQLTGGNVPYSVIVQASLPVDGVMVWFRKNATQGMQPGLVSLFHGFTGVSGGSGTEVYRMFFGPVYNNSGLTLLNTAASDAVVVIDLYQTNGTQAMSLMPVNIPAMASAAVNLSTQSVPPGTYLAVVSSSQPLVGSAQNTEQLSWGPQVRIRGPLQPGSPALLARAVKAVSDSGGARTTRVFSANLGAAMGTFTRTFRSQAGALSDTNTFNLPVSGYQIADLDSLSNLANGSTYAVTTTGADVAVSDLTEYTAAPGNNFSFASYRTDTGVMLPLPRLVKASGGVGSVINIYNPSSSEATITIALQQGYSFNRNVPAQSSTRVDLRTEGVLPASYSGGGVIYSNQPVTALVDEFYRPPCIAPTVSLSHVPFSVIYPTDLVEFTATATGDAPLAYAWTKDGVSVGTDSPTYSSMLSEGLHDVSVSVTNACGTVNATDTVSVSPLPCTKPVVTMAQSPAGVIYPTDTINFTTATLGTPPFTYAWSVDGAPDGTNSPTFDKSLPAGDHTVGVDVTNACGGYGYTRHFTVVELAKPEADLSLSTLNASTAGASAGDRVQFIAVLRNTGTLASPGSLFVNHIPGYTAYVEGSAHASDGGPVNFDGTSLTWSGDLDSGSPVVITYEVTVTSQPPDNMIHNTNAYAYDHLSKKTTLSADVRYVPGYSLKINNGAVGTSTLEVELTFTYNPADGLVSYQVSNNAAFDAQGDATAWLDLAPGQTTHTGWELDPLGDPRFPREVYIRFRKSSSAIVGPFMASILYDAQAPAEPEITLPQGEGLRLLGADGATLAETQFTAITSDDNSGVAVIQVSPKNDFSSDVTVIQVTGRVTTFSWAQTGADAYIRAVDRSGNASNTILLEAKVKVYLPIVRR